MDRAIREDVTGLAARASLCGRLGDLGARAAGMRPADLALRIEDLRREAAGLGLTAADRVARGFVGALRTARCRNGFSHWFQSLGDAIGCEAADADAAADACLAAVMVRMG